MEVRKELYIGGRWTAPQSSGDIAVVDSRTEEPMGSVPRGAAAEVEQAVAAARAAFPAWAATPVADRVATLRAIADGLEARDGSARRPDEPRGRHADRHVSTRPGRLVRRRVPLDRRHPRGVPPRRTDRNIRC